MARYVVRRIVNAVILILITITVTFFAVHLAPGDPLSLYFDPAIDPQAMQTVRTQLGLDDPLPVQFGRWMWSFLHGDFGMSIAQHRPVGTILRETIPRTLVLTVLAFLVQLLLGLVLGMIAAANRGRAADRVISVGNLLLYALPAFYLAYLLIALFALKLGWLPTSGMGTISLDDGSWWGSFADRQRYLVMPVIVLGVASAAGLARYTRGSVVDSIREDFIRTARAKGLPEKRVVWCHAFRHALPPVLTVVGLSIPFLLGGAVVVEKVFAWPGMGSLAVDAIFARDYPVVLATNFIAACMVILGSLIADVSQMFADPRVKPSPGDAS